MTQEQRICYLVTLFRIAAEQQYSIKSSVDIFAVACHKSVGWRTKQYYADTNGRGA